MTSKAFEVNFDGIVGPTHHYGGLSYGNVASMEHRYLVSSPKRAALQGLAKMLLMSRLGVPQAVLPPHERPFIPLLRKLGYQGKEEAILKQAARENPELLARCYSSAAMWTANAATVCPSIDSLDGKVHFVTANLISKLHRAIEPPTTRLILQRIFADPQFFVHHSPLPNQEVFADEGAANHTRFSSGYNQPGVHLFVYGRHGLKSGIKPSKFPARQTFEASQAVTRLWSLPYNQAIFAQQSPEAIDAGVFHNDVISVGNLNVFFYHEKAFADTPKVINEIKMRLKEISGVDLHEIVVSENQVPLEEAVKAYLFNSQLVNLPNGKMALIVPIECENSESIHTYLHALISDENQPIDQLIFSDVHESMQNGGGPACLRLRVVLTQQEYANTLSSIKFTPELYQLLINWIHKYYRDRLTLEDLADPALLIEGREALDQLTQLLQLGSIYPFQQNNKNV